MRRKKAHGEKRAYLVPKREDEEQARRQSALEHAENQPAGDERGVILDEAVAEHDGAPGDGDDREEARRPNALHDSCPEGLGRDVGCAIEGRG